MPGFFGDSDDEEIAYRAPPPPKQQSFAPRAGPSSERAPSPEASSSANGRAERRRPSEDVDMTLAPNGYTSSPARSALGIARPARNETLPPDSELGIEEDETLVARLTRKWVNEREAPELLTNMEDDLEEALLLMRMQSNAIASIRKVETDISEEEHFRFIIVQQDMERIKYIMKNYVRTRQYKMERFSYFLQHDPQEMAKLTQAEREYLRGYHRILSAHLQRSVLDSLPEDLRVLDRPDMYSVPDLNKMVHVLVKRPCGPVRLPSTSNEETMELALETNSQHFVRYKSIRELLAAGDVQLL